MLDFLKPKVTVSALVDSQVSVILTILSPEKAPGISELITQLAAKGADVEDLQIELAVFTIFTQWLGLATALQKGHINEARFDELGPEMWRRLDAALSDTGVDSLCIRERGLRFIDFAWERFEQLVKISTEAPRSNAQEEIVDTFSSWLCSVEPPASLKLAILYQYVQNTGAAADRLAWVRVVSS